MTNSSKPLVGVVCDVKVVGPHPFHMAGDKYLAALAQASNVLPLMIPALTEWLDVKELLGRLDGIFLPGGYSMVHPSLYGADPISSSEDQHEYDQRRDALSLTVIREVYDRDLPLFGVCRGFQEMNVAAGGTLYQAIHQTGNYQEHREDKNLDLAGQYAEAHEVMLTEGGKLQQWIGSRKLLVNSLHTQGVDRLGHSLNIEASAHDGLVEAFTVEGLKFGLGVQWHPEWQVMKNPNQRKLFEAFGDACRA